MDNKYLEEYYNNYDEENRLTLKHGLVEFFTTTKYIDKYLEQNMKILEVGAGTGKYSLYYANKGFDVQAVELINHNIDIFKSKIIEGTKVNITQGNACDLSMYKDNSFDITLVLGPMYHLFTENDKHNAIKEALRVTKKNGLIYVAFTMNDATIYSWGFIKENILKGIEDNLISENFHCVGKPELLFEMWTVSEINCLFDKYSIEKLHMVATDGLTNYNREIVDNWSDDMFNVWLKYHFTVCEREDLMGYSHHTLFIGRKK